MLRHPKTGQWDAITYKGVQAVETGQMSCEDATAMVIDELWSAPGGDLITRP